MILIHNPLLYAVAMCSANIIQSPKEHLKMKVPNIVAHIANQYFSDNLPTLFWSDDTTTYEWMSFYLKFKGCLLHQNAYEQEAANKTLRIKQYIITIKQSKDFDILFQRMEHLDTFSNDGKFILVCGDIIGCDAQRIFEICWGLYLVNIVLVTQNLKELIYLSTYFPFSLGQCENTNPKILHIIAVGEEYKELTNIFPVKVSNLNGCPLIVSTQHTPPSVVLEEDNNRQLKMTGLYGPALYILTEKLNASLQLLEIVGKKPYNYGDVFNFLSMKRSNMTFVPCFKTTQRDQLYKSLYSHESERIAWSTPRRALEPAWKKLIYPFDERVRLALGLTLVSFIIVIAAVTKTRLRFILSSNFSLDSENNSVFMGGCAIFIGQAAKRMPKTYIISYLFALWLWFSFIIRSAYQGVLVSTLKHDVYEPPIDTFEDALEAGMRFGGNNVFQVYLRDLPHLYETYFKLGNGSDYDFYLSIDNGNEKSIMLAAEGRLSYFNSITNSTYDKYRLHYTNVLVPQAHYLPNDSPLEETINKLQGRIVSSGFRDKATDEYFAMRKIYFLKLFNERNESLTLHNLLACYIVLGAGYVFSFFVFIIELSYQNFHSNLITNNLSLYRSVFHR